MFILPVLLPQLMDNFNISLTQITSLWTISYFLYGVMALPAGFISDKLGYKFSLMIYFIGTPITLCIVGSANSTFILGIGLALMGIFASIYHPAGLAMISHVRQRGKALGLQGIAGNIGLAFAPLIAGALASGLSWRYAYYILSLPGFLTGALFLPVVRWAESHGQLGEVSVNENAKSNQPRQRMSIAPLVALYMVMTVMGFCYQGVTTMLPIYVDSEALFDIGGNFQDDLNQSKFSENLRLEFQKNGNEIPQDAEFSIKKAGNRWALREQGKTRYTIMREGNTLKVYASTGRGKIFVTIILLIGMIGQYIGGHTADRYRKTRLYLLFNSLSLPFMIMVGFMSGIPLIAVAGLFALFHFSCQPVENSLLAQYTPLKLRSSGYGLKFVFAFGIGSFAAAFSGYIGENFGLNSVFFALSGVIFLAMIVMTILLLVAKEQKNETG